MRFSAPKNGLEMANLPSLEAAMAMTCAAVTAPCPPKPDIRMLILFFIMVSPLAPLLYWLSGSLRSQLFGGSFLFLLFSRHFGEELLSWLADVLFVRKALSWLFRICLLYTSDAADERSSV